MSHVLISKWEKKGAMPARFVTTSLVTKRAATGALDFYLRAAVHRRGQRPPKGSGTNMTVEAT